MKQKIFIVGITGGTGLRLARLLKRRGDEVTGLYRRRSQAQMLDEIGVTGTLGDIVQTDVKALAEDFSGTDVVVYTAGAGDQDSDAMIDAIDGDGVIKSIAAARLAGAHRFILVSVFPEAGRQEGFGESFEHYISVKKQADVALTQTDLDWVILRPSTLTDEPGTGAVSLGPAQLHTEIPRDDVAATIAELIQVPAIRHRILELTGGSTPIERAVAMQVED
jgi:uncharacterized protein YbjT (DUF2867 family)